jgi:hypothetical protein
MTKPSLPPQVAARFPAEIVHLIYSYVPHIRKPRKPSPSLQRALEALQKSPKRSAMDMYGLDDFVLC